VTSFASEEQEEIFVELQPNLNVIAREDVMDSEFAVPLPPRKLELVALLITSLVVASVEALAPLSKLICL